ncbi:MotA/TolQ/ExbB proton channel family protein [Paenibacillus camelliae]|uniref:MotA/TolQ/ExbB proton channel family protein n=1 Tax=Paenibacillus camelliae TaxID=512410 RepID=UPI00203EBDF3|nr:MotA/TolQ/ExbB proton channel family protein [Paenibacillus camelliae]MCM3634286.1 MotA/TolQ/ExbB proton channel family protein [Paenibacillus camelliae]
MSQFISDIVNNNTASIIFIVLFGIVFVSIMINQGIYKHLSNLVQRYRHKMTRDKDTSELEIVTEYLSVNKDADRMMSPATFVEQYYSQYAPKRGMNIVSWSKIINQMISICILIGVLGTFIGLTISFQSINIDDSSSLANALAGAKTSFYTSIFGICFSLLLTIVVKFWYNIEHKLTDLMYISENILESYCENQLENENQKLLKKQVDLLTEMVAAERKKLPIMNKQEVFMKKTEDYLASMSEQAVEQSDQLEQLNDKFMSLDDFSSKMAQSTENLSDVNTVFKTYIEDMLSLSNKMEEAQDASTQQIEVLSEKFEQLNELLLNKDEEILRQREQLEAAIDRMDEVAKSAKQTQETIGTSQHFIKQYFQTGTSQLAELQAQFIQSVKDIEAERAQVSASFATMLKVQEVNYQSLNGITNALASIDSSMNTVSESLNVDELNANMDRLGSNMEQFNEHQKLLLSKQDAQVETINRFTDSVALKDHTIKEAVQALHTVHHQLEEEQQRVMNSIHAAITSLDRRVEHDTRYIEDSVSKIESMMSDIALKFSKDNSEQVQRMLSQFTDTINILTMKIDHNLQSMASTNEFVAVGGVSQITSVIYELREAIDQLSRKVS